MFFSVKSPVKIMGKTYIPCVCYALPDVLIPTIDKMVDEDKAYKFENRVYFQNGKVLVKKPAVKENSTTEKPKKEKKAKVLPPEEFKEEVEGVVLPSPEEIADNEEF